MSSQARVERTSSSRNKNREVYERILEGAMTLIRTDGPEALGIRQVAKLVGMSTGTVTYYFRNTDALIEALLESHHHMLGDLEEASGRWIAEHADDPIRAIELILRGAYQACRANRAIVLLVQITYLRKGHLPPRRAGIIPRLAQRFSPALGVSAVELAVLTQTVVYSLSRYATMNDDELCALVGCDPESEVDAAHVIVLDQMVNHVLSVLQRRS
ncbi:MAG: TetR/AcrR family transcriptional regulator [Myxococcota bacterium]